ncbi:hypothetical protein C0Q70_01395 [Pomacea canaliculata]|uniref:U3 small nucleolar RNA-associated protein 13 C-terminal domain-containing protein n=1 Tax=Pomacea canaliculata TaxID=400727 RepID=A0A2T7PZC7_POMCA|nr:hypothetical protein C0Q70_01395 [Pomacea canaliculata]
MGSTKTNLTIADKYDAFYTGGIIQFSKDGNFMFCCCGQNVKAVELNTGKIRSSFGQEAEDITSFCLSPDDEFLVITTQNLLLRQWRWKDEILVRSWRAIHTTPVMSMTFDPTSTLVATGGSDMLIKLWDVLHQYCTHNLRGHTGVVRLVQFHPDISKLQLISAGDDYTVRVWNLKTSTCMVVNRDHHSLVTGLCFTKDGDVMYSCSRDSVVCIWDMIKLCVVKILPVFESVESVMAIAQLPMLQGADPQDHFVTAGTGGTLKIWNKNTGACLHTNRSLCEEKTEEGKTIITQALYSEVLGKVVIAMYDHNILFLNADFSYYKQGIWRKSLMLLSLGENSSHIIVLSNSSKIKVFCLSNMACQILGGHLDTVLAVSSQPKNNLFATASKDNSVRVWRFHPDAGNITCIAVGQGHTQAVHSVAFSKLSSNFLVSGSEDSTLKLWSLPPVAKLDSDHITTLHTISTECAHEKDINFVTVAPNDKFIASASQDKTAKLWSLPDLSLKGVVRGHRRGVWCVQFSPVDRFCFSDSEGLLKLWTIKTKVCEKSFDAHDSKAWALAVHPNEDIIITGGGDSTLLTWKASATFLYVLTMTLCATVLYREQKLSNYIQEKKLLKAIGLAISLGQPFRVLTIMKDILETPTGLEDLENVLAQLQVDQMGNIS